MSFPLLIKSSFALTGLLSLVAISSLSASTPEPRISVTFAALSLDQTIDDLYFVQDAEKTPVFIPNAATSVAYRYEGPPTLKFFKSIQTPIAATTSNPEPLPSLVATVELDAANPNVLLLFTKSEGERFRVFALRNDIGSFPANSFRFFNLCEFPVAGQLNSDNFRLQSQSQSVITLTATDQPQITVQLAAPRRDEWELVYRSKWRFNPAQRLNVFFLPDERQPSGLRIRRYYELAPTH